MSSKILTVIKGTGGTEPLYQRVANVSNHIWCDIRQQMIIWLQYRLSVISVSMSRISPSKIKKEGDLQTEGKSAFCNITTGLSWVDDCNVYKY